MLEAITSPTSHETDLVPIITFEDVVAGSVTEMGPRLITAEEIVAFAAEFDPQPMHLGDEGGRAAGLGGLIASGWHTCAILMRMIVDGFLRDAASMGSPGVEEVRWLKPVRPGDRLTARRSVVETRVSKSRPEMGFVKFRFEVLNQSGDVVMELTSPLMIGRRDAPNPSD
jgi:acyl dehydratase